MDCLKILFLYLKCSRGRQKERSLCAVQLIHNINKLYCKLKSLSLLFLIGNILTMLAFPENSQVLKINMARVRSAVGFSFALFYQLLNSPIGPFYGEICFQLLTQS